MVEGVRKEIKEMNLDYAPRLEVLRTSDRSDSDSYIRRKQKVLESAGIEFRVQDVSGCDRQALTGLISEMNANPAIHGILVQFPLGDQLQKAFKSEELMEMVDWRKDVDGFHPLNMIKAMHETGFSFESCTAKAVMRLLKEMEIDLQGVDVVLIGKSRVVGLPLLHQLLAAGATVQCYHSNTTNLAQKCRQGQIVIAAAGSPGLVKSDWLARDAIVIDVGVNYDAQGKLIGGDVDVNAHDSVAFVTPVPGGIGPLTIASLAENVLKSVKYSIDKC